MRLVESTLAGVYVVELEPVHDERGSFARSYSDEAFRTLLPHIAESGISFNPHKGTVRGMHYQLPPHAESKLVRCTRGAIFDVVIDLQTRQWFGIELTPDNGRMLHVAEGLAHGFQSLADETEVSYHMSTGYKPEAMAGVRWDDPAFAIQWPLPVSVISQRDRTFSDFRIKP